MQDEQMPNDDPVLPRHQLEKILFDFIGVGVLCESQAPGESPHMRIDNNPFGYFVRVPQNDVGCFAPDPRELHQRSYIGRYFPTVLRHKRCATATQSLGLIAVEASRSNILFKLSKWCPRIVAGCSVLLE
jgi:hypothetical protein